jgi:hypothetical protein
VVVAGYGAPSFFECIARVLQPLADGPFSSLSSVLDGLACRACGVFDGLARFRRRLLNGFASFFDWPLIVCVHRKRGAKQQNGKNCEMSHNVSRVSSYRGNMAALHFVQRQLRNNSTGTLCGPAAAVNLVCEASFGIGYWQTGE